MVRAAQVVYILFFSVLFGAVLRVAGPWKPFATYFFMLPKGPKRSAALKRLLLGLTTLNLGPFAYFAVTVYLLGHIHRGGGWLMLFDYFCVPWVALAVIGFYYFFLALSAWGGESFYGEDFQRLAEQHLPHPSPKAYLIPGLAYMGISWTALALMLFT